MIRFDFSLEWDCSVLAVPCSNVPALASPAIVRDALPSVERTVIWKSASTGTVSSALARRAWPRAIVALTRETRPDVTASQNTVHSAQSEPSARTYAVPSRATARSV